MLLASDGTCFSQDKQNKSQLAFEYYRNKEFDKAAVYYYELYQEKKNTVYRKYYIQCLTSGKDLETAEKFVKKELRKNKSDLDLRVEEAYISELLGKTDKANKKYQDLIQEASLGANSTKTLAQSFIRKRKYILAEECYKAGQNNLTGSDFFYELANLYSIQRKYDKMIDAYLDLLNKNSSYLGSVQTRIQALSTNDIDGSLNPILEKALIKRIQSSSNPIYPELLIWQYIQTGKYSLAKQQAEALDKRFNEKGKRLFELGQIASENDKTEIANECFDLIYKYGKSSPYYFNAKLIELSKLYDSATKTKTPSKDILLELESKIYTTANEAPRKLKYPLIKLLAQVDAFYLNKPDIALSHIDTVLNKYRLSPEEIADFNLLKGDIYLLDNNPWDATLIYAKVEQDNKENPYGAEAKFRKAKLAYYTGQFEWAKAQLDVLKASTSKLISNDSFDLSLFISENSTEDSLQTAMKMFAKSDLLQFRRDYNNATKILDSILLKFPTGELMDDVLFRKAKIKEDQALYTESIDIYNSIVTDFSYGILADNALIAMGRINQYKLKDIESAMANYTQLLLNYKGSIFVVEARDSLRELRGDNDMNKENNESAD
jgi:hypothetical protein